MFLFSLDIMAAFMDDIDKSDSLGLRYNADVRKLLSKYQKSGKYRKII